MPNFSLISVSEKHPDNRISGNWVQDHVAGTLDSAIAAAKRTEGANSNKIDIAVVDSYGGHASPGEWMAYRTRLDTSRTPQTK